MILSRRLVLLFVSGLLTSRLWASDPSGVPVTFSSFEYAGRDPEDRGTLGERQYRNPILAGFYPDPSVCRVVADYYLVNSSFAYLPGLPVFHSRDLVHWAQVGNVVDRPSGLRYEGLGISRGLFAPTLREHDGIYYLICTMVDAGGNFVETARRPEGPWSDPVWLGFSGIDPSLFFDDDGRCWITYNGDPVGPPRYSGHRAIWLQEYDPAAKALVGKRRLIVDAGTVPARNPIWIEGPHLFKRNGWYYLMCAEGGTAEDHSEVIFRSRALGEPFVPWENNPILTQRTLPDSRPHAVTSTGHADLVQAGDGSWWAVFLGCRPYDAGARLYATGRETFLLPVRWTGDGWPVILNHGDLVPHVAVAPALPVETARLPLTGTFVLRDDFQESALDPAWIAPRSLPSAVASLTRTPGVLTVFANVDMLTGTGHPAFVARRVQHAEYSVTTYLRPPPGGTSGGIALLQNEAYHFYFGVRSGPQGTDLFLERHGGAATDAGARRPLARAQALGLRVEVTNGQATFLYSTEPGHWLPFVTGADASILTTRVAGGFVGAVVGLHARREPSARP